MAMKVLYLIIDGTATAPKELIELHALEHEVETVDLTESHVSYESVLKKIFDADKVVSW
ncbi:MAG TPA: hypothetical protein VFU39_04275 [Sulfuricaulis sp.]|nr:hypothetical protein [Gammaproteobacteria bacterium]MDH3561896.1 hypothetical protein [Gammaproteobacteria bacterium]HEU5338485.1 hypothetical protein [Sulfuricaulis sp.]